MPTEAGNISESPARQTKRRRRESPESPGPDAAAKTTASKRTKKPTTPAAVAPSTGPAPPPARTLIIDNGGDTVKYGWLTDEQPRNLPNITARLAHQITVLVGDELERVQNPNSLVAVTRSCERGIICNMGNQTQVWKRLLDLLGVLIPLQSEAAGAFGWKATKKPQLSSRTIPSHSIAVVLLLPPHYPRTILDQITFVWMEDFGVGHLGFGNSSVSAVQEHPQYKTCCTVDLGWSSSLVVPTFRKQVILPEAIRRLPIGGRHLVNVLKYYMSYRQYNLMDQEHLLKDMLHHLLFVSLEFKRDLALARTKPSGRRIYDRDFVLPDYHTISQGQVRIPHSLQQEISSVNVNGDENEDDEDQEDDEDYEMDETVEEEEDGAVGNGGGVQETDLQEEEGDDCAEEEADEAEETLEQRRRALLRQRAEEERQQREQAEEEQILRLSVERFSVPEILFRPSDAGFPQELVGLGTAIVQAVQACPEQFHAALYQSIHLVGGVSRIQNLKMRVENEVRELASSEYFVKVSLDDTPIERGWLGAKTWASDSSHTDCMISRDEWMMAGKRKAYVRLLSTNGGAFI